MDCSIDQKLWLFIQRFINQWQQQYNTMPQSEAYLGLTSPCIIQKTENIVIWQPIKRDLPFDFKNVEQAIGFDLHEDIKAFYAHFYCADMSANFNGLSLELIQVWNDEDLNSLQENILGHLFMQKKLKQPPTVFIGSTNDELEVISVCNETGKVIKERIGTSRKIQLAPCLNSFFDDLKPELF